MTDDTDRDWDSGNWHDPITNSNPHRRRLAAVLTAAVIVAGVSIALGSLSIGLLSGDSGEPIENISTDRQGGAIQLDSDADVDRINIIRENGAAVSSFIVGEGDAETIPLPVNDISSRHSLDSGNYTAVAVSDGDTVQSYSFAVPPSFIDSLERAHERARMEYIDLMQQRMRQSSESVEQIMTNETTQTGDET
jgi:hypothetical protein